MMRDVGAWTPFSKRRKMSENSAMPLGRLLPPTQQHVARPFATSVGLPSAPTGSVRPTPCHPCHFLSSSIELRTACLVAKLGPDSQLLRSLGDVLPPRPQTGMSTHWLVLMATYFLQVNWDVGMPGLTAHLCSCRAELPR